MVRVNAFKPFCIVVFLHKLIAKLMRKTSSHVWITIQHVFLEKKYFADEEGEMMSDTNSLPKINHRQLHNFSFDFFGVQTVKFKCELGRV